MEEPVAVKVEDTEPAAKKVKVVLDTHKARLQTFLNWAKEQGIVLSEKVAGSAVEVAANYGLVATQDIKKGETLFTIPRAAILSVENCAISDLLKENEKTLESPSGWVPLIIALMYEKLSGKSKWKPYLDAFPNFCDATLPMYWPEHTIRMELAGTNMVQSVGTDICNMRNEFANVALPFIKKHRLLFQAEDFTHFSFYKNMAAFIMAYSFTDSVPNKDEETDNEIDDSEDENLEEEEPRAPTIMVPMADLLNHVPDHNAELKLGKDVFTMTAITDIKRGEEIYNTYGPISNYTLLLMYGFSVSPHDNPYNTCDIGVEVLKEACSKINWPGDLEKRFHLLRQKILMMDISEVVSKLSALSQDPDDENEDWMSEDGEDFDMSFIKLNQLPSNCKKLLDAACDVILNKIPSDWEGQLKSKNIPRQTYYCRCVQGSHSLLLNKLKLWLKIKQ